ncbi:uncharacterized protein LOC115623869 [Scaptodrosophila lebanonensis]|uniref:Uncharacterized protein LOC115623869 n=1 Tax=Drosophila lebanonensis TaxID=7225 RepID=A0A6J2TE46_DROLE|nr:uncharacterized protein LOC115623869 [Scaptodrosophila lebanonensis]
MSFKESKIEHPVIRQFILRTAVVNYLGKSLKLQWNNWKDVCIQIEISKIKKEEDNEKRQKLEDNKKELQEKVHTAHKLLEREYNSLFTYMMKKRELWDSPEYFSAKSALGSAIQNLRLYVATSQLQLQDLKSTQN